MLVKWFLRDETLIIYSVECRPVVTTPYTVHLRISVRPNRNTRSRDEWWGQGCPHFLCLLNRRESPEDTSHVLHCRLTSLKGKQIPYYQTGGTKTILCLYFSQRLYNICSPVCWGKNDSCSLFYLTTVVSFRVVDFTLVDHCSSGSLTLFPGSNLAYDEVVT